MTQKKFIPYIFGSLTLIALIVWLVPFTSENKQSLSLEEIAQRPKFDRPDLAAEHDFEMTKDPALGYPPAERKLLAYQEAKRRLDFMKTARVAIQEMTWLERGPAQVGGRTRGMMFDPNDPTAKKVWAGGVSGGLWYNADITNAASPWRVVDDFMPSLSISSIAYDPTNTQVFYVGTGEGWTPAGMMRGAGIWKTTDGGTTWNQIASTNNADFIYIQSIAVTGNGTVLAATRTGLKRSVNGGDSWTTVVGGNAADIKIASNGDIFASIGIIFDAGRVHKSINDGASWTQLSVPNGGQRIELAVAETDPNVIYAVAGDGGNIAWFSKSTDGGTTWNNITIPKYLNQNCTASTSDFARGQAWYDLVIAVHPEDPDQLIAGGIDLNRTKDGGQSWATVSYWTGNCRSYVHADQHAIAFRPGHPNEAIFGSDGGISYTRDITATSPVFFNRNNNYNVTQFYSGATSNESLSSYFLAGSQDNGTQKFTQEGFGATTMATGGDGAFCFIDQTNSQYQITSYVYNYFFRSTNGGNTFSTFITEASPDFGRFINPCDYDDQQGILYAARSENQLARHSNIRGGSVNSNNLSIEIDGRKISAITASRHTSNRIFIGNDRGQIYRANNANGTPNLTRIDQSALPSNGYVSSISIGTTDDHLLVTLSNYGINSIWESRNGGDTWQNKQGDLPDMPVRWALYNPDNNNEVIIATEVGIWTTQDITTSNPAWMPASTDLANVRCDMLRYREADGLILVATYGRGLYTSDLFAKTSHASFTTERTVVHANSPVEFNDISFGTGNDWNWTFGDGNSSTGRNPQHSYVEPGTYTVSLGINEGAATELKEDLITILPQLPPYFLLEDGGDFESNQHYFAAETISGTGFELGQSTVPGKDGTASGDFAWVTGIEGDYENNTIAYLYTPEYGFFNLGSYFIEFKTRYELESSGDASAWDGMMVQYSIDQGRSWLKLGQETEVGWYNQTAHTNNIAFTPGEAIFSGTTEGFETKFLDISFLEGNSHVAFRFVFRTDGAETAPGIAIDDFKILGPDGPPLANFFIEKETCGQQSATFYNLSAGATDTYFWEFGEDSDPPTAFGPGPHQVFYSSEGVKNVKLTIQANGSESIKDSIKIVLKPSIEQDFETLLLIASEGENYQWYFNGNAIDAAVERELLPKKFGDYSVLVSLNGCSEISENFSPDQILSVIETPEFSFDVYPNPSNGLVNIQISGANRMGSLLIYNVSGQLMNQKTINGSTTINLGAFPGGIYFIQFDNNQGVFRKKVILTR